MNTKVTVSNGILYIANKKDTILSSPANLGTAILPRIRPVDHFLWI